MSKSKIEEFTKEDICLAEFAKAPNSAAVATNRAALSIPHRLFFSNLVLDHVPGRLLALHERNFAVHHFL